MDRRRTGHGALPAAGRRLALITPALPPDAQHRAQQVRRWTHVLDSAIRVPGTSRTIGMDPLLGLVPWAGDAVGAALSAWLVWQSARVGAPTATLSRMVLNVAVETVLGVVPVLGDLFDAGWKANTRNLALLERHLAQPDSARAASRRFWGLLALGVFGSVAASVAVAAWALWALVGLLIGG